jgi:hypothetical protein
MERNFKVCLIVGASLLFLLGLVIIGSGTLIYLNRDKLAQGFKKWTESVKEEAEQGEEFGAETDQDGCLQEALRQSEGKGSFGAVQPTLFLTGCLRSAEETEGFCDDVPPATEIMATVMWSQRQCAAIERTNDQACIQVMQSKQRFCGPASQ